MGVFGELHVDVAVGGATRLGGLRTAFIKNGRRQMLKDMKRSEESYKRSCVNTLIYRRTDFLQGIWRHYK